MATVWWLLFVIYLIGFLVSICLFLFPASASSDEPEDGIALTVVMGLFWPVTLMVLFGEWRKDRRKAD